MAEQETHHVFGPSTIDALSQCVRFKYNESDEDAADEGKLMHKAFETGNLAGLDAEQQTCVTTARDYVESLKFEGGSGPSEWQDFAEVKLELKGLTFGTSDRLLVNVKRKLAHVIDFKATRRESAHGWQLRTYGACAVERFPEVEQVVTHVVAPRLGGPEREAYGAAKLLSDVREHITELYARIADPKVPPTPDEDLCCKCANAATCPALCKTVTAVATGLSLPLPDMFAPDAIVSLRDRALAQVLAGAMINWGEQVKKNNAAFVDETGTDIPGFKKMRRSTGLRVPKERVSDAADALKEAFGMSVRDVLSCCGLTVGDVVAHVSMSQGVPEANAKEMVREALADVAIEGSCSFLSKEKRMSDAALLINLAASQPVLGRAVSLPEETKQTDKRGN